MEIRQLEYFEDSFWYVARRDVQHVLQRNEPTKFHQQKRNETRFYLSTLNRSVDT